MKRTLAIFLLLFTISTIVSAQEVPYNYGKNGVVFSQSINEKDFYRKFANFGRIKLAFASEYQKLSSAKKSNPKEVKKLAKKWVQNYLDEWYGNVSKDEKKFMFQQLMDETEEGVARKKQAEIERQQEAKQKIINQAKYEWAYFNDKTIVDAYEGKFMNVKCIIVYVGKDLSNITNVFVLPPSEGERETNPKITPPILVNIDAHYGRYQLEVQEDNEKMYGVTDEYTFIKIDKMLKSTINKTTIKHDERERLKAEQAKKNEELKIQRKQQRAKNLNWTRGLWLSETNMFTVLNGGPQQYRLEISGSSINIQALTNNRWVVIYGAIGYTIQGYSMILNNGDRIKIDHENGVLIYNNRVFYKP